MHLPVLQIVYVVVLFRKAVVASHFRGGTISWKPTGNGTEVEFSFKLGWAYNQGPGCNASKIGQLVTNMNNSFWLCTSGCNSIVIIANINYICTGASESENWEQGENTFTYAFPGIGPYTVEFTGSAWVSLSYGWAGGGRLVPLFTLRQEMTHTNQIQAPLRLGNQHIVQYGCHNKIHIPVVDPDGDDVRCRWANGSECVSICEALPYATIDYNTCTISFIANHTSNGTFAVAVTVQDFPKSNISIENDFYSTSSPLSTITIQFIVKTPFLRGVSCNDEPQFVSPTLPEGTIIGADIFQVVNISFFASGRRRITDIDLTVPAGMEYSSLQSYSSNNSFVQSTWIPQQNQVGSHIVCALAVDSSGKRSESRCLTIVVKDIDDCASNPCQNRGTCSDNVNQYNCTCVAGYTGDQCQTDIDECYPLPCQQNGTCTDAINMHSCVCPLGFTGSNYVDECASSPCNNSGTCNDLVNGFSCSCIAGFTGDQCQTEIDECASEPCENNGTCSDGVNMFSCRCPQNFTGMMCESDVGPCDSSPCKNVGSCVRQGITQNYTCSCVPGYTGRLCETDINECADRPCSLLFECVDFINGFSCKLVVWKLLVIGLAVLMLLGGCTGLLCFLKKKRHKTKNGVHPEHQE